MINVLLSRRIAILTSSLKLKVPSYQRSRVCSIAPKKNAQDRMLKDRV